MRAFQTAVFGISKGAAVVSAALLVLMVLHILLEIVLRSFFASSTFVLDEFVGYGVAAMTFLSLGYALETDSLIRVQLLLGRSAPPVRRGLEILAAGLTLALTPVPDRLLLAQLRAQLEPRRGQPEHRRGAVVDPRGPRAARRRAVRAAAVRPSAPPAAAAAAPGLSRVDAFLTGLVVLALIVGFLAIGTWVFAGLLLVSVTALALVLDFPPQRIGAIATTIMYRSATAWELAAIPMFVWMGEMMYRTDISERLFRGLAPLVDGIAGRLLHTNVMGCTLFAAVSGSSAATTATVGKITTTELARRRYDTSLAIGSLAGAGSLGLLIPPSIVMIIYGVLAEVSIAKLFAAGVVPGLIIAALYSAYIAARCTLQPELAPPAGDVFTWRDRLLGIAQLLPVLCADPDRAGLDLLGLRHALGSGRGRRAGDARC